MNYETTDWDAETNRLADAFGIKTKCRFQYQGGLYVLDRDSGLECSNGFIKAIYRPNNFQLHLSDIQNPTIDSASIYLDYGGNVLYQSRSINYSFPLAKSLYYLELLTPEAEQALGVLVSSHQKVEWTSEYEQRLKAS